MKWNPHPLLCLYRTPTQPMRRFFSEILSQEGYHCVDEMELNAVDDPSTALAGRALAFISAETLTQRECETIGGWVHDGGAAVLISPPTELIQSMGLRFSETIHHTYHTMPPGYAGLLSSHPWTGDHGGTTIQTLSPMFLRRIEGERALAMGGVRSDELSTYPAVIEVDAGKGKIVIFWFDPGQTALMLRQGDPRLATNGILGDPTDPVRYKPGTLFEGLVDCHLRDIPQADVWADLLVSIIRHLTDPVLPIPRLWLFPNDAPALTLLDGDSDAYNWDTYSDLAGPCADRGVPYTLNIIPHHLPDLDRSQIDHWLAHGHDFQLHYWPGNATPTFEQEARTLHQHAALFQEKTGLSPIVGRAHSVIWPGYTEMAEILSSSGFRMECNFLGFRGWQYGYLGSARPARFMRPDGTIIHLTQQPTIFIDDVMQGDKSLLPPRTPEQSYDIMRRFYDESASRFHGVICTCLHPYANAPEQYRNVQYAMRQAILDATEALGLLALTARAWCNFCDARRCLELRRHENDWTLTAAAAIQGVTLHRPASTGVRRAGLLWSSRILDIGQGESVTISE
ncbi:MAG: hypothetical protein IT447_01315 [Phycisphaerales bacterium]|nr:hypothetical protein [Phycisphaerales bacterium]